MEIEHTVTPSRQPAGGVPRPGAHNSQVQKLPSIFLWRQLLNEKSDHFDQELPLMG